MSEQQAAKLATAIEVTAPSRLHFGMFSFGQLGERQFGGVGAMIDAPGLRLRISPADRFSAMGPLANRAAEFASRWAGGIFTTEAQRHGEGRGLGDGGKVEELPCCIEVLSAPPDHVGLGVGTQLGLAVAAGLEAFIAARSPFAAPLSPFAPRKGAAPRDDDPSGALSRSERRQWGILTPRERRQSAAELARLIGRAGRSGVGTFGFERGGLIVDGGKHQGEDSSLVARVELPRVWRFVLLRASGAAGLSGDVERQAFAKLPPVPRETTAELHRLALEQLVPAASEARFDDFSQALYEFGHRAGLCFASRQGGDFASPQALPLIELARRLGVAGVGQSSWGPTVFALLPDAASAADFAGRAKSHAAGEIEVTIAAPNNWGAQIRAV